jgi:hypothetical protein
MEANPGPSIVGLHLPSLDSADGQLCWKEVTLLDKRKCCKKDNIFGKGATLFKKGQYFWKRDNVVL